MKKYLLMCAVVLWCYARSHAQCSTPSKLTLTTSMVTTTTGGNASYLVDEQSLAGDPALGSGGATTTIWEPATYPGSAYIDLGASIQITAIHLRDMNNVGNFIVSSGTPGNWTPLFTEDCSWYLSWKSHPVNITTRYLHFSRDGGANVSEVVIYGCSSTSNPPSSGSITYQKWTNIQGATVADLTSNSAFPNSPTITTTLTSFEGSTDVDEFYGSRILGYITPTQTGTYYFWIAGDDATQLWLSTNSSPSTKQLIAYNTDWTNSREWNKYASQKSGGVTLTSGNTYYIEALMKEGWGGDNLAVGWRKPSDGNGTSPVEVIPGSVLSPFNGFSDTQAPTTPGNLSSSNLSSSGVTLTWTASTDNVAVTGYEIYRNNSLYSTSNQTSANVIGLSASTSYSFKVRAVDAANNASAFTSDVNITTLAGSSGPEGYISYQRWDNISGTAVSDLTSNVNFPNNATVITDLSYFESPANVGDHYGARIIGYITAPQTGAYTFWVAGDDNVELWLSTNDSQSNKVKIAYHTDWTDPRQWNKFPSQKSAQINLTAGAKYYVEALLKESLNADQLSVAWRKPSDGAGTSPSEVIPGTVLSRFFAPDTQAPTAPTALNSPGKSSISVTLSWTAATDNYGVAGYSVYKGGTLVNSNVVIGTSYTVTNLAPSTAYTFTVKAKDAAGNLSPSSNSINVTTNAPSILSKPRIPVTASMVVNEIGLSDERGAFTNLFDEQSQITNYAPEGPAVTHWRVGGDAVYYPAGLIIDLGQEYDINNIYWFDGKPFVFNGVDIEVKGGSFTIETGTPFNWTPVFTNTLVNDSAWHNNTSTFRTRYIHLKKNSTATYMWQTYGPFTADAPLMEMVFYGTPVGSAPPPPTNQHTPFNITMDKFIGGNSWWYGDTTTFKAVGIVRAYHPISRSGSNDLTGAIDLQTYDDFYGSNLHGDYEIYPCVMGHFDGSEHKPTYGGDPSLPATYRVHADNLWQWTARFGHNSNIDLNLLRLPHWQTKVAGLGYLNYIENWNEEDRWWAGADAYFSPYQFAAMSSADYDGHLGAMGNTVGVKNADPNMKLVMGGLANIEVDYVKAMKLWADAKRGGSFPADVLNFHWYTGRDGKGISFEDANFLPRLQSTVQYRNLYLPGKEVWISEFGWDVDGGSTIQANGHTQWPNNGFDSEHLQAIWLVRAFMIIAKAGFDRAEMYSIGDAAGWGTYATCGLVTYNGVKRKSWYYVGTLKNTLRDMVYVGEVNSGNPNVWIYKFKKKNSNAGVYAVWSPTSNGTTVNNYQLTMGGNPTQANLISLLNGSLTGTESNLAISAGKVTINVSENPVFVSVDNIDGTIPSGRMETITGVEKSGVSLDAYPNPASHELYISGPSTDNGIVSLIDMKGVEHKRQQFSGIGTVLDVKGLARGLYIVKVQTSTSTKSIKVVLN